ITPAYSFTDYRYQGRAIANSIIDIRMLPTGGLTPFNVYVALSRDERLARLDDETEKWWKEKTMQDAEMLAM
ncbi:hypothetical protein K503DRAFT_701606, partial [Rhizopogon vinicolor AM-OR11-026]